MKKPIVETWLERGLFASRWLMAPFYVGLVLALAALLVVFFQELFRELPHILSMKPEDARPMSGGSRAARAPASIPRARATSASTI